MLERQGIKLNRKKLYRLYKEERLTVRKRGGRKTRSRYGGMEVSDARRLKALEEENRRLGAGGVDARRIDVEGDVEGTDLNLH
jgi:hypothetical protein